MIISKINPYSGFATGAGSSRGFLLDTFTSTAPQDLSNHIGEIGAEWESNASNVTYQVRDGTLQRRSSLTFMYGLTFARGGDTFVNDPITVSYSMDGQQGFIGTVRAANSYYNAFYVSMQTTSPLFSVNYWWYRFADTSPGLTNSVIHSTTTQDSVVFAAGQANVSPYQYAIVSRISPTAGFAWAVRLTDINARADSIASTSTLLFVASRTYDSSASGYRSLSVLNHAGAVVWGVRRVATAGQTYRGHVAAGADRLLWTDTTANTVNIAAYDFAGTLLYKVAFSGGDVTLPVRTAVCSDNSFFAVFADYALPQERRLVVAYFDALGALQWAKSVAFDVADFGYEVFQDGCVTVVDDVLHLVSYVEDSLVYGGGSAFASFTTAGDATSVGVLFAVVPGGISVDANYTHFSGRLNLGDGTQAFFARLDATTGTGEYSNGTQSVYYEPSQVTTTDVALASATPLADPASYSPATAAFGMSSADGLLVTAFNAVSKVTT